MEDRKNSKRIRVPVDRYDGEYIPDQPGSGRYNGYNGYGGYNGFGGYNGNNGQYPGDNEQLDIRKILYLVWYYKWLILALTVTGTISGHYYIQFSTPIYQADGTMIISKKMTASSSSTDNLSSFLENQYGFGAGTSLENELSILRSRTFAKRVADRIYEEGFDSNGNLYPLIYNEYPDDNSKVTHDKVFERVHSNLVVERADRVSEMVRIQFKSPSPEEAARIVDIAIQTYSDISVENDREQAQGALGFLDTEMKSVSTKLEDAESELLNFMNREKVVQLDNQTTNLITSISTLTAERQAAELRLVSLNASIEMTRNEMNMISPDIVNQISTAASQRVNGLQVALAKAETDRVVYLSLNPNAPESDNTLRTLNRQIASLRNEITTITAELVNDDMRKISFLSSSDGNMATRFGTLRESLMTLETERAQIQAKMKIINQRIQEQENDFVAIPENMMELARRKRDLEMNEKLYSLVSQQAIDAAIWEQSQRGSGRVVDLAQYPTMAISPRKDLLYLIFTSGGAFLAFGIIFIRKTFNNKIGEIEDLETRGLTMLSVVPDIDQDRKSRKSAIKDKTFIVQGKALSSDLSMILEGTSPTSEAYRRLQSNLMYSQPDSEMKLIVVTSPNQGEGKTTVSGNLAIAMAEAGKKVLIIDVDFRRPRLHHLFGEDREPGLIDVIFNEKTLTDVIKDSINPNVKVLTTGKKATNPVEVSRSKRLDDIITELEEMFDHIIIDTPPFGIISDSAPIIARASAVITCCRFNHTKSPELDILLKNLKQINANIAGSVLTSFNYKKSSGSYYTTYYYKYNYQSYGNYHSTT